MIATKWDGGGMLFLNVYECVRGDKKSEPILTRKVWANHSHNSENDIFYINPSEQEELIDALSSGDLRGRYAEEVASFLYTDLFLLNPKSGMKEIIPKVVEKLEKHYIEYGFEKIFIKKD